MSHGKQRLKKRQFIPIPAKPNWSLSLDKPFDKYGRTQWGVHKRAAQLVMMAILHTVRSIAHADCFRFLTVAISLFHQ